MTQISNLDLKNSLVPYFYYLITQNDRDHSQAWWGTPVIPELERWRQESRVSGQSGQS
jgi:hypothetical protein